MTTLDLVLNEDTELYEAIFNPMNDRPKFVQVNTTGTVHFEYSVDGSYYEAEDGVASDAVVDHKLYMNANMKADIFVKVVSTAIGTINYV